MLSSHKWWLWIFVCAKRYFPPLSCLSPEVNKSHRQFRRQKWRKAVWLLSLLFFLAFAYIQDIRDHFHSFLWENRDFTPRLLLCVCIWCDITTTATKKVSPMSQISLITVLDWRHTFVGFGHCLAISLTCAKNYGWKLWWLMLPFDRSSKFFCMEAV